MKRIFKVFKQIYKDNAGIEQEREFIMTIVKDCNDYNYRVMNLSALSVWKDRYFDTFEEAETFLNSHPYYLYDISDYFLDSQEEY